MIDLHGDAPENPDPPDYPLQHGHPTSPPAVMQRSSVRTLAAGVLLLVVAMAAWVIMVRGPRTALPGSESAPAGPRSVEPVSPLGVLPAAVSVPPLDQSDAVVRDLVRQLTTHPTVVAWLATDGLIRNLTVSISNVADGITPERHLRRLRPSEPFAVAREGGRLVVDPASFRRYDTFAAAAASVDPDGAARLYATLKPRIEEAYRDLGHPDTSVDHAVEQAIVQLLRTPVVDRPLYVQPGSKGIGYSYTDADLETLTGAQRQLLRMGPDNVRDIQRSLRAIAHALGIPPSRLPAEASHS